jgi:hypothetical protein
VEGTGSVIRPTAAFVTGGDENSGSTISVSRIVCLFREFMTSTSSTLNIFLYVLHAAVSLKTVYRFPNILWAWLEVYCPYCTSVLSGILMLMEYLVGW